MTVTPRLWTDSTDIEVVVRERQTWGALWVASQSVPRDDHNADPPPGDSTPRKLTPADAESD